MTHCLLMKQTRCKVCADRIETDDICSKCQYCGEFFCKWHEMATRYVCDINLFFPDPMDEYKDENGDKIEPEDNREICWYCVRKHPKLTENQIHRIDKVISYMEKLQKNYDKLIDMIPDE